MNGECQVANKEWGMGYRPGDEGGHARGTFRIFHVPRACCGERFAERFSGKARAAHSLAAPSTNDNFSRVQWPRLYCIPFLALHHWQFVHAIAVTPANGSPQYAGTVLPRGALRILADCGWPAIRKSPAIREAPKVAD